MRSTQTVEKVDAAAGNVGLTGEIAVRAEDRRRSVAEMTRPAMLTKSGMDNIRSHRLLGWIPASFIAVVLCLPVFYGLYLTFIATPRYATEFRVLVRSVEPFQQAGVAALLGLGLGGQSATANDSNAIVQYLKSLQGVEDIDKDVNLREKFSQSSIDFLSRFEATMPLENLLRYWKKMIDVYYETSTGTIIVNVSAFTPEDSLQIARSALSRSESLVNRMSEQTRKETVAFTQEEVMKAERRLMDASANMTTVMNEAGTLSPQMSAQSIMTSVSRIRDELSELNAKLNFQKSTMSSEAPPVRQTEARIAAAETELDKLNARITGANKDDAALSQKLTAFTMAETERGFAEKAYQSALASLETAKIDAARRQAYLATVVKPQLAQEPSFPHPITASLTALAVCLLVWMIGVVTVFAVKEHL